MSNRERLEAFVQAALNDGRPNHLEASARKVEGFLRALSEGARKDSIPAHLEGLTAEDLAGAMERLDAAAVRKAAA